MFIMKVIVALLSGYNLTEIFAVRTKAEYWFGDKVIATQEYLGRAQSRSK
jgi:hypothetical protein